MRQALLVALLLTGCMGTSERVVVRPDKLQLGAAEHGQVTVTGLPGAVTGHPYGISFAVRREGGYAGFRVQHLAGEGLAVTAGFALVQPDGSFPGTTLGDAENAVRGGDELNVRAMDRQVVPGVSTQLADIGENVALPIP